MTTVGLSALDESWDLYEAATQLAIRKKDYARAFIMAERGRTRTLAEARRQPLASLAGMCFIAAAIPSRASVQPSVQHVVMRGVRAECSTTFGEPPSATWSGPAFPNGSQCR